MRKYKNNLLAGNIHSLLITGSGGQGKTSLAGKRALDLQAHGYRLFAWSARPENSWRDFELEMEQTLDRPRVDRYDKFLPRAENESARAQFMLDLLMEQFNGRVVIFLDNLETIQDADTLALKDATVDAWLRVANQAQGVILLVTSRWQIPNWDGEHEPLTHVNYGDFLQIAQRLSLPPAFLTRHNSLRQVYDILGGNVRGLEFFASAVRDMENADEESAFIEKLATVKEDLQTNVAIEAIYNHLRADAKTLLRPPYTSSTSCPRVNASVGPTMPPAGAGRRRSSRPPACSIADRTVELGTAYALERQQFGKPIGTFQAVKHLLADMLTRSEVARAAVYAAGVTLDDPSVGDPDRSAAGAKLIAGHAAIANAKSCIQVHGGIVFTWEVDVLLFLKRAWVLETVFGTGDHHAEAMAALV